MCALHMHIERPEAQKSQRISLTPPVASLMQSCVDSAQTVLRILRVLGDEDLLGTFLHLPKSISSIRHCFKVVQVLIRNHRSIPPLPT